MSGDSLPPVEIAAVLLVTGDGSVLLQHRTDDAPAFPGLWSVPGGEVEAGEMPEQAAVRELAEETGLHVGSALVGELVPWLSDHWYVGWRGTGMRAWVWAAPSRATQAEVGCYEGQDMRWVRPEEALALPLAGLYVEALPRFLAGPLHTWLTDAAQLAS